MSWLELWHVVSVGLFSGAVLATVAVHSLLARALDDAERKPLAHAAATLGQAVVMPTMYLGFVSGLVFFAVEWHEGALRRPMHVDLMAAAGVVAVGLASMWKAKARQLARALEGGEPYAKLAKLARRSFVFATGALFFTLVAYAFAMWKSL